MLKWKVSILLIAFLSTLSYQVVGGSYNKKVILSDKKILKLMKVISDPTSSRNKTGKSIFKLSFIRSKDNYSGQDWRGTKNRIIDFYSMQLDKEILDKKILEYIVRVLSTFRTDRSKIMPILMKAYHERAVSKVVSQKALIRMAGKNDKEVLPIILEMLPRTRKKKVLLAALVRVGDTSPKVLSAINQIKDHTLSSYAIWRLTGKRKPMIDSVAKEIRDQLALAKSGKDKKLSQQTMVNLFWLGKDGKAFVPYLVNIASGKDGWCRDKFQDQRKKILKKKKLDHLDRYILSRSVDDVTECRDIATVVLWKLDFGHRKGIEAFYAKNGIRRPATAEAFMLSGAEANTMIPLLERIYKTGTAYSVGEKERRIRALNLGMKRQIAITLQTLTGKHYPEAPPLTPNWKQEYMDFLLDRNWQLHWLPF